MAKALTLSLLFFRFFTSSTSTLDNYWMNSSISAWHPAELEHVFERLFLCSYDVENWRRNGWQTFPHCNPQWNWHQGVWDEKDKTSHQLRREIWFFNVERNIQVDLKEPGQKVDLGWKGVALQSSCTLTLTYSWLVNIKKKKMGLSLSGSSWVTLVQIRVSSLVINDYQKL